ncbi:hypothetical protein [Tsukamurella pseudospumae]|uniref:Uncharacterized protein n=1 Tax=Tsukamurella pseudospumae TaxID=239498 RepID=A0A137ZDM6_9ACTN|nr:hypothetical protein [Tsukamurella pseudospumae]KXO96269.1 hypothetical protein AXK61_22380 [Tsukamurella pseudospumae]
MDLPVELQDAAARLGYAASEGTDGFVALRRADDRVPAVSIGRLADAYGNRDAYLLRTPGEPDLRVIGDRTLTRCVITELGPGFREAAGLGKVRPRQPLHWFHEPAGHHVEEGEGRAALIGPDGAVVLEVRGPGRRVPFEIRRRLTYLTCDPAELVDSFLARKGGTYHMLDEPPKGANPVLLIGGPVAAIAVAAALAWGATRLFGLGGGFDAVVTVLLFAMTVPLIAVAGFFGVFAVMLSDGYPTSRVSYAGIALAVFGPITLVIAIEVGAMILAARADGPTFYYPLISAALSAIGMVVPLAIGAMLVEAFH